VDGALGEDCSLEGVEVPCDFWVLLGPDKLVLEDETKLHLLAFDEGEHLGGTGVNVGGVDAAGLEETDGGGDAETG